MTTMRQLIERDRALRTIRKPAKMLVANGLHFDEKATGQSVFYCAKCYAPVVDSQRAREIHAQKKPQCRAAMAID